MATPTPNPNPKPNPSQRKPSAPPGTPGRPGTPARGAEPAAPVYDEQDIQTNQMVFKLLPWAVSIAFHTGLVLIAVFFVWVRIHNKEDLEEQEVIIPVVALGVNPGGPRATGPTPGMPGSPQAPRDVRTMSAGKYKQELGGAEGAGVGNKTGAGVGGSKVDSGLSGIIGSGGGSGAGNPNGSPFGSAVGRGDGPFRNPGLYGTGGGNVKRVVYVIDASGSLVDSLPFVLVELRRSISQLSDSQQFTVIFFQEDKILEIPPAGLKHGTSEKRAQAIEWMTPEAGNVVPHGATRPLPAIEKALSYKPDLIFILSDNVTGRGRYEVDQKVLLASIEKANTAHAKINTIQFLQPDSLISYGFQPTLKLISERSGGIYKFVGPKDLGLQ